MCDLPPNEAEEIIAAVRAESGLYRKSDYLKRRLMTEAWLIDERTRKLGKTPLCRPIYFFLGDMTDDGDKMRPASITVPLKTFDPSILTFTYPDSMTSCPQLQSQEHTAHPYRGQVYTLREIEEVVSRYGFPDPELPRHVRGLDSFIEVQVWDNRLLV